MKTGLAILLIFQVFSVTLFFSDYKGKIRSKLLPKKESLLSVIHGDVTGEGDNIHVLKFKTPQGIRIEFLRENEDTGFREVIFKTEIKNHYNGFFEYRGQSVQLGMSDVDGDGVMEILAPSFDTQLMAHLKVYTYDERFNNFREYHPYENSL